MFATRATPGSHAQSSSWPSYNNNASTPDIPPTARDASFPPRLHTDSGIFTQQALSLERSPVDNNNNNKNNSTGASSTVLVSTPPPRPSIVGSRHTFSTTSSCSPALSHASPLGTTDETIQTPFVFRDSSYAIDPLLSPTPTGLSTYGKDLTMSYPNTPSPPASYGINGGMIVQEPILQATHHSCTPLAHPSDLLFSSSKQQQQHPRPALRPSLSHNSVYHSPTPLWPSRRNPASAGPSPVDEILTPAAATTTSSTTTTTRPVAITSPARPATAGTILDVPASQYQAPPPLAALSSSAPAAHHPHPPHEAAAFTTLSSNPHHHQHPPHSTCSYNPSLTTPHHTPYSDDLAFHTSAYQTPAYDTSFSSSGTSGSPWAPSTNIPQASHSPHIQQHVYTGGGQGHHIYTMYPSGKQIEPLLAPGEVPAPRPPLSYAALIGEALLLAPPPHHLYVSEISDSIKKRYAYYRQNPSKIYNGVRHQTSMCKAFVKLARPFGDQSGGARKWAIRAGCESWFQNGGYHPPGTLNTSASRPKGGKAKATARSKALAVGTSPPGDKKMLYDDGPWSAGPSSGPAYDGSGRPFVSYAQPAPSYAAAPGFFPPGYHYLPVAPHGHPVPHPAYTHAPPQANGQPPMYMSSWGPFSAPPPPQSNGLNGSPPQSWSRVDQQQQGPSPEQWQDEQHHAGQQSAPSEHGSHASYDDHPHSPISLRGTHSPGRR